MDTVSKVLLVTCGLQFGVIIALHFFYSHQIQKLLDKLMSRDYRDYHTVHAPSKKESQDKIKLPDGIPEDLRTLQGFQIP